ncbi:MAG: glutamate-1-semialdehyde 2,1-aminomutase [Acidobacteriota bacterium]
MSAGNQDLFTRAKKVIPGGVNSPVRAFQAVGGTPRFIRSARGCRVIDVEGKEYIDYLSSWGPLILGHSHPEVVEAISRAAAKGSSYGAPTEEEVLLAEKICSFFPSIEKVRLVNSGTEATMSALRLARAQTGRPMIVKFDGCYHGHSDSLLVQAGSGVLTLGIPGTPGIPPQFAEQTISLPFNDTAALRGAFQTYSGSIAAVILEPVPGNMGVILPDQTFLEETLRLAETNGTIVIFDEVITGFRLGRGGAQEHFSLSAPLTCLGKILGSGLPIGAYGGRRDLMENIAPEGPVYQAGTLSGNPIAVAAGLKTLEILEREHPYQQLQAKTARLCRGLSEAAQRNGVEVQVQQCGSMFTAFFNSVPPTDLDTATRSDTKRFAIFFHKMLEQGIYLAPSQYEACFVSTAHGEQEIDRTVDAAEVVFREMG